MTAKSFLKNRQSGADNINVEQTIEAFVSEMRSGLAGQKSSLAMLPTFLYDAGYCARKKYIVIDAGGTNFRSAIGGFDGNNFVTEYEQTSEMPASRGRLSADEFYRAIANNVRRLLPYADDIGFCFSYPVKMTEDGDGVIMSMPKGIDAPEIIGTKVGERTLSALREIDDVPRKIVILNDTVAALLGAQKTSEHSARIGYIYGTGTNVCCDVGEEKRGRRMIINTECGNFDKFPRSEFETAVAIKTDAPNSYSFEKAVAGKYLANVIFEAYSAAVADGVLNIEAPLYSFTLAELSDFLSGKTNALSAVFPSKKDMEAAVEIAGGMIDRAAKLGAIAVASATLFSQRKAAEIAAEGTTFYKLKGYRERFEKHLGDILYPRGIRFGTVKSKGNLCGACMAVSALASN